MATIRYLIQSASEQSSIYLQYSLGRGRVIKRRTGFTIDAKKWSSVKGLPILKDEVLKSLKIDLDTLKTKLEIAHNLAIKQGQDIDGIWLQKQIDLAHNKVPKVKLDLVTNYIAHIITNAATRKNQKGGYGLSSNRIKVYRTFQSIVQTYENELGHAIYIRDIDPEFIKSFTDWLMKSSYALSTIGKFIANFKTVCNDASLNGLKTSSQLKLIKVINERKDNEQIICLSFEELDKIEKLKLKKKYLLNARDWLILGCYVGQRGGDLLSLAKNNIKQLKDLKILELEQQKTGKQVVVPLYSKALEITERGFPYSIPLQKFNNHIKELCKIAGIDTPTKGKIMDAKTNRKKPGVYPKHQLVSSHICRRSFATNFYGQIPTPILMSITGHATEDMFLQYIGKTRYDNAYQMVEYFNKLNV